MILENEVHYVCYAFESKKDSIGGLRLILHFNSPIKRLKKNVISFYQIKNFKDHMQCHILIISDDRNACSSKILKKV